MKHGLLCLLRDGGMNFGPDIKMWDHDIKDTSVPEKCTKLGQGFGLCAPTLVAQATCQAHLSNLSVTSSWESLADIGSQPNAKDRKKPEEMFPYF